MFGWNKQVDCIFFLGEQWEPIRISKEAINDHDEEMDPSVLSNHDSSVPF